ncbi:hypothetical protein Pmani_023132 [Petrolisthes manimaculis]|uniref:Uncharacterized protein n=1 Tax=Petrolisthes manimaculis TaxID=1843537 RepID=A0AAE1TZX2_9EUCA|nr:hypothetical protein Pmani_023132 [Petrolisthes manimaculis]
MRIEGDEEMNSMKRKRHVMRATQKREKVNQKWRKKIEEEEECEIGVDRGWRRVDRGWRSGQRMEEWTEDGGVGGG